MNVPISRPRLVLSLLLLCPWLVRAGESSQEPGQPPRPAENSFQDGPKARVFSGRIVDGLGRPVAGVSLKVTTGSAGSEKSPLIVRTGDDGRFSITSPKEESGMVVDLENEGFVGGIMIIPARNGGDITLNRTLDWDVIGELPYREGAELDKGMREALAAEEVSFSSDRLLRFLFKEQALLRPALRRLVGDLHVGKRARNVLDLLGDPGDQDLFPKGRENAPKHEVREDDLVDAIKATARHLNFFSSRPEPEIEIEFIAFNPAMDRALVRCGINLGPFTGVFWRFVFQKEGKKWVLRSMEEVGRG